MPPPIPPTMPPMTVPTPGQIIEPTAAPALAPAQPPPTPAALVVVFSANSAPEIFPRHRLTASGIVVPTNTTVLTTAFVRKALVTTFAAAAPATCFPAIAVAVLATTCLPSSDFMAA